MKTKDGFKLGKRFTCWVFDKRKFSICKARGRIAINKYAKQEYAHYRAIDKPLWRWLDGTHNIPFRKRENAEKFAYQRLNSLKGHFQRQINKYKKQIKELI